MSAKKKDEEVFESRFYLNITGQIASAYFPLGPDGSMLYCRYDVVAGDKWSLVNGLRSGVTQCAKPGARNELVTFNMPLEFTFSSTTPHGWPQIVCSLYGNNFWHSETSRGYARVHVPLGGMKQEIRAPISIAKCPDLWSSFYSWASDCNPEIKNPLLLANPAEITQLSTETYGELVIVLQSISRGASKLNLDWGQS